MPDADHAAVMRRIRWIYVVLLMAGMFVFATQGNRRNAGSFLAGAAVSGISLWLLTRLVRDLGGALEGRKPRATGVLLHALRLVFLGGALFVILKVYAASPFIVGVGLLVPVASITLEALYELIYARA